MILLATTLLAALATLSPARGGDEDACPVTCPPNALLEGEICGQEINDGCFGPPQTASNCCYENGGVDCDDDRCMALVCGFDPFCCMVAWDEICADEAVESCFWICGVARPRVLKLPLDTPLCGTVWGGIQEHDTDWYEIHLDAVTNVTVTLTAGVDLRVALIDNDGMPDCALGHEFDPTTVVPACTSGSITSCLEAGTHWIVIEPLDGQVVACNPNNGRYLLSAAGAPRPCALPDPPNDTCATALPIAEGVTTLEINDAAMEDDAPPIPCSTFIFGGLTPGDVWYAFEAPRTGTLHLSTCGTVYFPAQLAAYSGTCGALALLKCSFGALACPGEDPGFDLPTESGTVYYLRFIANETTLLATLTLSYGPCAPPYQLTTVSGSSAYVVSARSEDGELLLDQDAISGGVARWTAPGPITPITGFSGMGKRVGTGVNSAGLVAANLGFPVPTKPLVAPGNVFSALPLLPGDTTGGTRGINESGLICGFSKHPTIGPRPVTWFRSAVTALAVPVGATIATAINNRGVICGEGTNAGVTAGWILEDGVFRWFAPAEAHSSFSVSAVNEAGVIVGRYDSFDGPRGYAWDGTSFEVFDPPPSAEDIAVTDIADDGTIIGYGHFEGSPDYGIESFLRRGGHTTPLQWLVSPTTPYFIDKPRTINTDGIIAVSVKTLPNQTLTAALLKPNIALGDLDCDGNVNAVDLAIVLGTWGACAPNALCPSDFNLDGVVDAVDLAVVLGGWGVVP